MTPEATIVHYAGAASRLRSDKAILVLKSRVTLARRYLPAWQRPLGLFLLRMGPFTRWVGGGLLARLTGRGGPAAAAAHWGAVWAARADWQRGFPDLARPEPGKAGATAPARSFDHLLVAAQQRHRGVAGAADRGEDQVLERNLQPRAAAQVGEHRGGEAPGGRLRRDPAAAHLVRDVAAVITWNQAAAPSSWRTGPTRVIFRWLIEIAVRAFASRARASSRRSSRDG